MSLFSLKKRKLRKKKRVKGACREIVFDKDGHKSACCFFMSSKIIITHADSDKKEQESISDYESQKQYIRYPEDSLLLINYKSGIRKEYHCDGTEKALYIGKSDIVDLECLKETILQMNLKKKIKQKQYAIIYRLITDGFIGGNMKNISVNDFREYVKFIKDIPSSSFYGDRLLERGELAKLMADKRFNPKISAITSFANSVIKQYNDLIHKKASV